MNLPDAQTLYDVCEATWPPAASRIFGPVCLRDGRGGGKRVSAATLEGDLSDLDLAAVAAEMRAVGQPPLFQIRMGEEALDAMLQEAGYKIVDPVNLYIVSADTLATETPPRTIAIPAWEPLRIMEEIWETGGIGPERIDVMHRACHPKTGLLSRFNDQPAGTSFLAMHKGVTMLHALEVLPRFRRNGLGRWAMRKAAHWTLEQGGNWVSVLCTQQNEAANALYKSLGMICVGAYHYRIKPEEA